MASGDSYTWIGGSFGSWTLASNWEDLTTGTVASVAPGIDNSVTISTQATISGDGAAHDLTISDDVDLTGDINAGNLTISATLTLTGGAQMTAAAVSLVGGLGAVIPDSQSSLEVGNDGTALPGSVTIDAGSTLAGSGTLFGSTIVNNGSILSEGTISIGDSTDAISLQGSGVIEVKPGDVLVEHGDASGAALTFQLDGSAVGEFLNAMGPNSTINLIGNDNTVLR